MMAKSKTASGPRVLNDTPEVVPIDKVEPHPRNPRRGDVGAVRASIRAHGFFGALIVQQSTRRILVGNQRWEAAKTEGLTRVPVIWVDVNDDLALRILLVDNKTSDRAEWDYEQLGVLLREWSEAEADISALGWEEWEVEPLLAADWTPPEESDEEFVPQDRPGANPNQATVVLSKGQYARLSEVRRKMMAQSDDPDSEIEDGEVVEALCEWWLDAQVT